VRSDCQKIAETKATGGDIEEAGGNVGQEADPRNSRPATAGFGKTGQLIAV
jgi:hypothetical protein